MRIRWPAVLAAGVMAAAFLQDRPAAQQQGPDRVQRGPDFVTDPATPEVTRPARTAPLAGTLWGRTTRPTNPRRTYPRPGAEFVPQEPPLPLLDSLLSLQEAVGRSAETRALTPSLNFAGRGFTGVNPSDPVGAVGPSHYVQMINSGAGATVSIYSTSTGALAAGPFNLGTLGSGAPCSSGLGDPVALYDRMAGRWLLSEFASSGNHLCVYVSLSNDPTGAYYRYDFATPQFPDYPKYAAWPNAYYVTTNESSPAIYALDRTRMLSGLTATMQRFTATDLAAFGFQALTPADFDGSTTPPVGAPGYFARHRDDEVHNAGANDPTRDFVEIWQLQPDFATPANSVLSGPTNIGVASFDSALCGLTSFNCAPQPGSGTTLDPLREVIMWRLQYRNFGSYAALVGSFAVDVNGADRAGVRWFELRKTGAGAWGLQQEGTYSPDATHRWMSSIAMDKAGNIALGYSVSSSSVYPGLRFTGRQAADAAGTMTVAETTIVSGAAANASNRWGDYHAMTVDPSDDCTFWFTGQYSPATTWSTRILKMKFDSCGANTAPVASNASVSTNKNTILNGTLSASDADGDPLTYSIVTNGARGTSAIVNASTGTFSYTPLMNQVGSDTFTFKVNDGTVDSPAATVIVTIANVGPNLFTDATLSAGVTAIRAVHVTELRTRIDALRAARGLLAFGWTDSAPTVGQSGVRAIHVTQLRVALDAAYVAAVRTPPSYTDPVLTGGQTSVKAVHIMELRAAVVALE